MRRLIFIILAITLINSCAKLVELDQPITDTTNETATLPEILYACMADEDDAGESVKTRTYVVNDKDVLWHNGDAIAYIGPDAHRAKYVYEGEDGASSAEFTLKENVDVISGAIKPSVPYVLYPYTSEAYCKEVDGVNTLVVNYPSEQSYAPNSFGRDANLMVGVGETADVTDFHFRNACGYLVIKLYGNVTVKSITLSATDGVGKIAGEATIVTDENKIPVAAMSDEASSYVTLDCSNGGEGVKLSTDQNNPTEFWFALPPVNIKGGIKIVVTDMYGNTYTKQTTKDVNITRNNVQPMAALEFVSNTPAANMIWYTKSADRMAEEGGKNPITFGDGQANPFDATIKEHKYDESAGKFVIVFDAPVKTIKEKAFYDNYEIETIELPDGLETIEELGLGWMWRLKEITIPGSVNTIGFEGLYNCQRMNSVTFLPSPTQTPLEIGRSYTPLVNTEQGPFIRSKLTSINLNRELVYVDTDGSPFEPDEEDEGIF